MSVPATDPPRWCATFACDSARSQVASLTALLDHHGGYVEEFAVFDDTRSGRFHVRCVVRFDCGCLDAAALRRDWQAMLTAFGRAEGALHDLARRQRVLLMVSKADHALRELLAQWRRGDLFMQPVAVVSNHLDLAALATADGLPFHHLPVSATTKPQQEAALRELIAGYAVDWIVLARYMQVLSEDFCRDHAGRVVNIHHSFLPGFKGARPYEQAYERGVKLIGATAHFATSDLDEGPIIEQSVERVAHADSPDALLSVGRHVESLVLSRALRCLLEHRVFVNGRRTVVLR